MKTRVTNYSPQLSMRSSFLILSFVVLCLAATGCGRTDSACVCGVKKWITFTPEGERFSVNMPFAPVPTNIVQNTAFGSATVHLFTATPLKGHTFGAIYSSYPPEVDLSNTNQLFDLMLRTALGPDGSLVSAKNISLQGNPGREWKFEKRGQALVSMRIYLVGRTTYQATCVMLNNSVCQKHVDEFLESVRLQGQTNSPTR